jgi:hypothetical protein
MLQLVQSTVCRPICMRESSPRPELFHQFQQVPNLMLENVPSLDRFFARNPICHDPNYSGGNGPTTLITKPAWRAVERIPGR